MNQKVAQLLAFILISFMLGCTSNSTAEKPVKDTPDKVETTTTATVKAKTKSILFFGNSLTAGYGIDPGDAFVGVIEKWIDSIGFDYKVVNAGVSGETTAGGLGRIDWILEQNKLDIFVLELGGNDGLRGIAPEASKKNLQGIIDKVKAKSPDTKIILAGMEAPPNMGADFTSAFRNMYPSLAKANRLALIPFLLDKVGGISALNLPDGIHPTEEGHEIVANNIWKVLEPLLEK